METAATVEAPASDAIDDAPTPPAPLTLRRRLVMLPPLGSLIVALLFWWESLRPSLLPRAWLLHGGVGAICAAIGVAIGGLVHRLVRVVSRRTSLKGSPTLQRRTMQVLGIVAIVAVLVGSWRWYTWQRDQRELVTAPPESAGWILGMWIATAFVFALIMTVARLIKHGVLALDRRLSRRMRQRWARTVLGLGIAVVVLVGATWAGNRFANWADQNFGAFDETTADGVEQPTEPTVSGGPGSLVDWDDLGFQGRTFTGGTTTVADLQAYWGAGEALLAPIRAYVGLDSADTLDERVQLAVDELRRTGAFEREILVVVTPTGTGWVNPDAARTLEFMYRGDTAIVSVQYSFLPSWVATLVDTKSPGELGAALFEAVHSAWSALPADTRPRLAVYGESLGSFGGEAAFPGDDLATSLAALTSQVDAAMFVGPTRDNRIWSQIIDERDAGSPTWKPVVAAQSNLRVVNRIPDFATDVTGWAEPRVLYLHQPSDPIGTWRFANAWSNPGWADNPPPYDIPEPARWVPIITFVQETVDLMNGFGAAPGFGHDYRPLFADAWAAVAPPDGWTQAETDRLAAHLGL